MFIYINFIPLSSFRFHSVYLRSPKEWADDPEFVCAVISCNPPVRRPLHRRICLMTEFKALSKNTKKKYRDWSIAEVERWMLAKEIPPEYMQILLRFFPRVVCKVDFFKAQALIHQDPATQLHSAALVPIPATDTLSRDLACPAPQQASVDVAQAPLSAQHVVDLLDAESDMWTDFPDDCHTDSPNETLDPQPVTLDPQLIRLLLETNRSKVRTISFVRLLQHWFVSSKVPQQHITTFLKLIKKFRPTLTARDIDKLPNSARTLLKLDKNELLQVQKTDVRNEQKKSVGTYMHYGVAAGVLGTSPGMFSLILFEILHCLSFSHLRQEFR